MSAPSILIVEDEAIIAADLARNSRGRRTGPPDGSAWC